MRQRVVRHFEAIIAALLGVAAIAAAFAAYQSGKESGAASESLALGALKVNAAFSKYTNAAQQRIRDQQLFLTYLTAHGPYGTRLTAEEKILSHYIRGEMMSKNLRRAIRDFEDPDSETFSPVQSPKYKNRARRAALELLKMADEDGEAATEASKRGDRYDVVGVILTVALFFFGLAGVLAAMRTRLVLTGVGAAILVVSLAMLATI